MINTLKNLTNEQLVKMIQENGTKAGRALEQLIENNDGLIKKFCKKYVGKYNNKVLEDDLIQVGRLALVKAAERFKFDRGTKYSTCAGVYIKKYMLDEIQKNGYTISIPANKLDKIVEYGKELDNDDSDEKKQLKDIRDHIMPGESLDKEILGGDVTYIDTVISNNISVEALIEKSALKNHLQDLLESLDPLESQVIGYRFGLNSDEPLNISQIARAINISRDRVYTLEEKAMKKLYKQSVDKGLDAYLQ